MTIEDGEEEEGAESSKGCWIIPSPLETDSSNNSRENKGEEGKGISLTVSNNTEYLTPNRISLSRSWMFSSTLAKD